MKKEKKFIIAESALQSLFESLEKTQDGITYKIIRSYVDQKIEEYVEEGCEVLND